MPELMLDLERYRITQVVNELYHRILQPYIAEANRRELMDMLYEYYAEGDIAIISKAQLKQYQEMELTLSIDMLKANAPIIPKE